ncbi:TonB-dependent receptor domain-containing protein [Sphingomonas mollis]|uniref:TonB-dependent receptor n=1 Tax=Sphingomonas mollis TaxID=2795726 RepID=A0ABS0XS92_9SPHN|nr:TonB-dependent receptor [Sphingomonas sp. BT553]MBJ6122892.1 TonB-dependent receptor [Sphingomonas sp. BT553]
MMKLTRQRLLASTLFMGSALVGSSALAQTAPQTPETVTQTQDPAQPDDQSPGSDIVVTGTLIRNPNLVSATPVTSIGSDEIALRQSNVAEQLLRETPGVASSIGSSTNNGNGGASFVDLRGLGQNRNIVLLNSARIVPANLNGAVDLNNIPLALLDRVDILTGGASTTYGADAVSGVVNFITKRDFSGIDLNVSEQITDRGDGNVFRADLAVGANFDDGRGNAVLALGYQQADPVFFGGSRERSNLTIDSFDGSGSGASQTAVPSRFSVSGVGNRNIDPATGQLVPVFALFNFNPYNIFQTPFERFNMYSAARYQVSDAVEVYSEGLYSQNTVQTIIAPSGTFSTPLLVPINNPFLPAAAGQTLCQNNIDLDPTAAGILRPTAAQCIAARNTALAPGDAGYLEAPTNVSRRLVEAGGRISSYRTELFNFKAGFRGDVAQGISYDVYGAYGRSTNTQTILNYVYTDRVQQGLRAANTTTCRDTSNGCVPVNIFGAAGSITPDQVNYLLVPATSGNRSSLAQVHGVLNAELGHLGASQPVSVAVGSEYRKYTAEVFADLLAQDPGALGGAGGATVPVTGGYDVIEGFGEIVAPLIADQPFFQSLTAEAGVRYSKYKIDAAGSPSFDAWTYKGGLTWEPVRSLKLRGNYQRAVRAPNIGELFTPNAVGLVNLRNDPCQGAAPVTNANLRAVCIAQGAPAGQIGAIDPPSAGQINGNFIYSTNNRPEKADTYTFGAVFAPDFIRNLTISADYYNIKIRDALSTPAVGDLIAACFGNLTAASATSTACTSIRRDPATGGLDGDPSTTPGVPQTLTNSGRLQTDGIDVVANYRTDLTADVRLGLSFNANYVLNSKFRATSGGLNRECAGYYSINCSLTGSILPEFTFNQRTTLSFGDIDLSLLWRHLSSTKQEPFDADSSNFGANGPAFAAFRKIDAFNYFDMTIRANVTDNFELTLTGTNITDKKPPTVGSNIGVTTFNSGNTFPATYDAIGRRYAVGARVRF